MAKNSERRKQRQHQRQELKKALEVVGVAAAIENPLSEFPAFQNFNRNGLQATLEYSKVEDLDEATLKWILDLEKRNMEQLYNDCSWGWNDKKKKQEMTESAARYLLVRASGKPVAFSHFRFDVDYGIEVLYCYELQLEEEVRRKGLGKFMLQVLELMAFKNNMKRVVLTVLKHNAPAVKFFNSLMYLHDETNLDVGIYDDVPYEILSKENKRLSSKDK